MNLENTEQHLEAYVGTDTKAMPTWFCSFSAAGRSAYQNGALSMFLPEGDPNRTNGSADLGGGFLSEALRQRVLTWLQEQATARLGRKEKP